MNYCVGRNIIHKDRLPELHAHLRHFACLANNLHNASRFRIRQNFTMRGKDDLNPNQQEILDEINATMKATGKKQPSAVLTYTFLEKLMRVTENPDFFAGLPMQTAQAILKETIRDMKSWLASLRKYKKDPSLYTGKPNMPGYAKSGGMHTFTITNQDCVLERRNGNTYLKFPKIRERLQIENLPADAVLKEVKVSPYYDCFEVLYTYECTEDAPKDHLSNMAAIDFGVDNAAAIVTNEGHALLVKGGAIKAENQWFNKQKAFYVSELTKGHETKTKPQSAMLDSLSKNRRQFLLDAYHQISKRIVDFCLDHKVCMLVLGKTKFWKQNANIGRQNNQAFTSLPIDTLRNMITYKAERVGITVIEQEESYTSKASFLDMDHIPVYGVDDQKAYFSGKRTKRGLYVSKNGTLINADLNGAANILRKAEQTAFEGVKNFSFLQKPKVIYFTDLHKSNPVKGIAAA